MNSELSLAANNGDGVANGGSATAQVQNDVPVSWTRRTNMSWKMRKEPSMVMIGVACLVVGIVGIVHQQDVALGVAIDLDNVAVVELKSFVEVVRHGVYGLGFSVREATVYVIAQAPLPAGASVKRGVEVGVTGNHRNWAAGRGCSGASCSPLVCP